MGPETLAELDPLPLPPVRKPPPRPVAALPQMTRAFMAASGLGCAAAAALLLASPGPAGATTPVMLVYLALALAAAALMRLPQNWLGHALGALLILITVTLGAGAVRLGWGLAAPGLSVLGLLVCVLTTTAGWRAGLLLAALSAVVVLGLAGLSPLPVDGAPAPLVMLGTHLIILGAGLAAGTMISRLVGGYMATAQMREQRFRSLLALAADGYWEIDDRYRLVAASGPDDDPRPLQLDTGSGLPPWEMSQFACDGETLDALQADLDARQAFRDLLITWTPAAGAPRHYLASGEPRFDSRGFFTGYWGVVRDVSEMHSARAALAATETRYEELFAHIPTPLVLHVGGHVTEANPAAVAMFGHAALQDMIGTDLLRAFESGDSRERERRRLERLQEEPLGTALPVADFRLRVHGRTVSVRATTVRVDTSAGPAMLAIFVDDTDRLAAEEAVRRSESMLAHLVATSPDLITLTDIASGRFAMVNHTFERITGWTAAEAVGRTAGELGLWTDAEAGTPFQRAMQERGTLSDLPVQLVTRQGQAVAMLVSAARFVMDRRDYMVINARDVSESERSRLEREAILNNASIGIAVTRAGRFVLANPHFEQIHGWAPGQLIGQPGHVVWPGEDAARDVQRCTGPALERGEPVEMEALARRQGGGSFTARVRARAVDPMRPVEGGTAWIVEDITERRQFEQALARARDEAESANRAKSAFLANTSHELRTPLNGMIGLARMARAPELADERRRQYLDQIADSAQALAGVISDILDLSKIEAGKLHIEATAFDLGELLHSLHQTYASLALAHGLTLQARCNGCVQGMVLGDPLRVRQIISNFLNNALKFTPHGSIELVAWRMDDGRSDTMRVEVHDTGLGIDDKVREHLFEPFMQADQSTTRRYGGTGLGLSICRELATLMGGRVGVESQVGQGSVFWAELPLPAAGPLPAPEPVRPVFAPALPGEASLEGAHVLMVEDNPVNMMIAAAMLERWGVVVTQANDGSEAVAAVQAAAAQGKAFDAVLMDVQMPVMSGHEATRLLRSMPLGRTLPIIALTAAALVTERDEALAAGMNDFLTKPIDAEKLRDTLLRWRHVAHEA